MATTYKIGIVGHIDLEDPVRVKEQLTAHLAGLKESHPDLEAYSSIAAGSDSLFAEAALELGLPLTIFLPFNQKVYAETVAKSGIQAISTFNTIKKKGTVIQVTNQSPATATDQNRLFEACAKQVVDSCDTIVFAWDGYGQHGTGGTGGTHVYAVQQQKDIHVITAYRSAIFKLFTERDNKANWFKKKYEVLWICSLLCSLAAAVLLALTVSLKLHDSNYTLAEISLVFLAFCFAMYMRFSKLKVNRLRLRREAERLRVLEKFYKGNITINQLAVPANLSDEVKAIEKKYAGLTKPPVKALTARNKLVELIDEQIRYHEKDRPELHDPVYHFLEKSHFYLFLLFIAGVLLHAAAILIPFHDVYEAGLLLSLGIPPLYAATEAYINFKEYHKIFNDSTKMLAFFKRVKKEILEIDLAEGNSLLLIDRYGTEVRNKMDEEISEWEEILKKKENPGP